MAKLGTYSTLDCPTENVDKAFDWLKEKYAEIDGNVRKIMNPHDFGEYPSFEIDYPSTMQLDCTDPDCDEYNCDAMEIKDDWHDKSHLIEAEFSKLFFN
jgi:hypothetical protein